MDTPGLDFTIKVNKARHDKVFQLFLARSFGQRFLAQDGTTGVVFCKWRGVIYIIQEFTDLPYSPPKIGPFPIDP